MFVLSFLHFLPQLSHALCFAWTFPSMKRKILIFPCYDSLLNNCSEIKALPRVFLFSPFSNLLICHKHYQMKPFIFPNNCSRSSFSSLLHCLACSAHMSFLLVFHSACPESHPAGFAMLCFVLIYAVSSYNMNTTPWILAILPTL